MTTDWRGLVPECQVVESATMVPGYPADEWNCGEPARLLCAFDDQYLGETVEYLVCVACALRNHLTIVRVLDRLDHGSYVMGLIDAATLPINRLDAAAFAFGHDPVAPYQGDEPYITGWNTIIGLRVAHLVPKGEADYA